MPGSGKPPCTPTCRGGIALRPLTQPQFAGAAPAHGNRRQSPRIPPPGLFPPPGREWQLFPGLVRAASPSGCGEKLRGNRRIFKFQTAFVFFFFNANKRALERPAGCTARATRAVPCENRAGSAVTSAATPQTPRGAGAAACLCSKQPLLFPISKPAPRFFGSDPSCGVCWHCPAPCTVTPRSLPSSGNGKFW